MGQSGIRQHKEVDELSISFSNICSTKESLGGANYTEKNMSELTSAENNLGLVEP